MNIFVYGDSNTWGYMPNLEGYNKNAPTFQYLNSQLWWAGLERNCNYLRINGLCGRSIANDSPWLKGRNALKTLDDDLSEIRNVDLVIIQLGTNDCKTMYELSPEQITNNLEKLAKKIEKKTGAGIMLISPAKIRSGNKITDKYYVGGEQKSFMLDGLYKSLAIKNGYGFVSGLDLEVGEDGEHLTPAGHKTLANRVNRAVEQYMAESQEKE